MADNDAVTTEWSQLLAQLDQENVSRAVIDLGKVSYLESAMLESLLDLWKRIKSREGRIACCRVSRVAREILQIARFDTLWIIADSRNEAVDAVKQ